MFQGDSTHFTALSHHLSSRRRELQLPYISSLNSLLSLSRNSMLKFMTRLDPILSGHTTSPLLCSTTLSQLGFKGQSSLKEENESLIPSSASISPSESTVLPQQKSGAHSASGHIEERVMISEILVKNKDGEELERKDLQSEALAALKSCRANSALTAGEVQEDVRRIIESGFFCSCLPVAVDTPNGIKLVFQVEPNQEFRGMVCEGASVLPTKFLAEAFHDQYGKVINIRRLDQAITSINGWYKERGLFGLVSGVDLLSGGILKLRVAEAEVNSISICFLDRKTGEPTKGKTKIDTILRQLTIKKGQVYSMLQGKSDADTLLTMGIMEDVNIVAHPAGDAGKVDLILNIVERPTGSFSAGGGMSSGISNGLFSGLVGSFAYSHRNVLGRNQKLNVSLERGQIDSIFRINYTDPWIKGDDKWTSRTIMVQNSRTPGNLVHGEQPRNGDLSIGRITAGLEFGRPLRPKWTAIVGLVFQHAGALDDKGNPIIKDHYGSPLTASGRTRDDALLAKFESVYMGSSGHGSSMLMLNMEQGLPIRPEWLVFNRVHGRAKKGIQVGPALLLFSLSGGHVVGKFPPHEAFPIGGTNSVRGYEEGSIGSGRSYVVGSSEISFPLWGPIGGVVFGDYGTDLASGAAVLGDPAGARLKPGSGYGYGLGLCVSSPLGPLRLEYAFNDRKTKRFHFGVGHRS